MGRISPMGDCYLHRLLVVGTNSLIRRARATPEAIDPRLVAMLECKLQRVVAVAVAGCTA
jgi:transposase